MGFQDIMKGATIDAKIFTPCGFSLNALFEVGLWVLVKQKLTLL